MKKNSYKAKYVHIIFRNEVKFGTRVVKFINDMKEHFDSSEHLFVTPHMVAYEAVKEYDNVILDEEDTNLINKYAPMCRWVICHGHFKASDMFKIKNKYLDKVIYRFWGGNFGFGYKKGQIIQNFIKLVLNADLRRRFNKFAAIGIAKNTDIITLSSKLKNDRFYRMPYTGTESESILEKVRDKGYVSDGIVNVAVYHRGTIEGNHIEILKKLERFGDRIRIYVPLSYGDKDYIEKVKAYIKENSAENVIIVDKFMEYEDYVTLMNKMDIAIFDCETSTALGNVAVYLFLKKKMILNRNGVIKKAFDEENIPHGFVDELDLISFEEFTKMPEYPEDVHYDMMPLGKKRSIEAWKKILTDFN
ncbi:MAG: hypothetical protein E7406_00240 [Ruminococcaceae bacterium]|nr:hypothetical protein [Oscillospiraceae bacterium]